MSFGVIGGGIAPILLDNFPWWVLTFFLILSVLSTIRLPETRNDNKIESLTNQNSLVTEREEESV